MRVVFVSVRDVQVEYAKCTCDHIGGWQKPRMSDPRCSGCASFNLSVEAEGCAKIDVPNFLECMESFSARTLHRKLEDQLEGFYRSIT